MLLELCSRIPAEKAAPYNLSLLHNHPNTSSVPILLCLFGSLLQLKKHTKSWSCSKYCRLLKLLCRLQFHRSSRWTSLAWERSTKIFPLLLFFHQVFLENGSELLFRRLFYTGYIHLATCTVQLSITHGTNCFCLPRSSSASSCICNEGCSWFVDYGCCLLEEKKKLLSLSNRFHLFQCQVMGCLANSADRFWFAGQIVYFLLTILNHPHVHT